MQYAIIVWMSEHKEPTSLSQSEYEGINEAVRNNGGLMPQWIKIRGEWYNTSTMDTIKRVAQIKTQLEKCEKCKEYKQPNSECPRCDVRTPEQIAEGRKKMDAMRKDLSSKLGWKL